MESLYTKYRPQTFADVVGQGHVVATLERAVVEGRTGHAYLFCGPRGTGKTTMARLLAKALLCEQGPGHLPDGSCEQCRLVAAGEHPDVYELDAASNTGVDNVREEIIGRVDYAPVMGSRKVYIIDEVHMLTTAAFNALLKTLEEPPSHVVFILCTTDPQKILETILSRVQRFDFHAIGNDDVLRRLRYVCDQEGFAYEDDALDLIVRHAQGGMRDALTKLEQLATGGGGSISLAAAQELLGEVSAARLAEVSLALARRDVPALFATVAEFVDAGRDLLQVTAELAGRLRDVYVVAAVGARPGIVAAQGAELERLSAEAGAWGLADRLSRALSVLSEASTEMRLATNQRLVLELAFTRLARPEGDVTLDALAERLAVLERRMSALEQGGVVVRGGQGPAVGSVSGAMGGSSGAVGSIPDAAGSVLGAGSSFGAVGNEPVGLAADVVAEGLAGAGEVPAPGADRQPSGEAGAAMSPSSMRAGGASGVSVRTAPVMPGEAGSAAPVVGEAGAAVPAPAMPEGGVSGASVTMAPEQTLRAESAVATPGGQAPSAPVPAPGQAQASRDRVPASARAPQPSTPQPSTSPSAAITDPGELQRRWKWVCDELLAKAPSRGSVLMQSSIVSDDGTDLLINLPKGSGFAVRMLERADVRALIDPLVTQQFGRRRMTFAEASLVGADIARADREAARGPVQVEYSAPVAPTPAAPPAVPVPAPAPAPAPAPQPVSAGVPTPSAGPSQQASGTGSFPAPATAGDQGQGDDYPMPWDDAPLPDEMVPYDDADIYGSYDDGQDLPPIDIPPEFLPPAGGQAPQANPSSSGGVDLPSLSGANASVPAISPAPSHVGPAAQSAGGPATLPQDVPATGGLRVQGPAPSTATEPSTPAPGASTTSAATASTPAASGESATATSPASAGPETETPPASATTATAASPTSAPSAAAPSGAASPPSQQDKPGDAQAGTSAAKPKGHDGRAGSTSPTSGAGSTLPEPAAGGAPSEEEAALMALLTEVFGEGVMRKDPKGEGE